MQTQYRLGIDAGGTFTDFVLANKEAGTVQIYKALSTPDDPTLAIASRLGRLFRVATFALTVQQSA